MTNPSKTCFASKVHPCSAYWKILLRLSFHGLPPGLSRSDKAFFSPSGFVIFYLEVVWDSHQFSSSFSVIGETGWEFRGLFFNLLAQCMYAYLSLLAIVWLVISLYRWKFLSLNGSRIHKMCTFFFSLWRPDKPAAFGRSSEYRNSCLCIIPPAFWNVNICALYPLF